MAAAAATPGADVRYCSECGRAVPASQLTSFGNVSVCTQCQPAYSQRLGGAGQGAGRRFGGFWIRFLAIVIDGIILWVATFVIRIPLGLLGLGAGLGLGDLGRSPDPAQALAALPAILSIIGLSIMIQFALSLAYEIYFLTTRGATPGKMVLGLKVIRADGGPISTGLAVGRYFAKILSGMILWIGFIIAGFDSEKRAVHDYICGTRVVYTR